MTGGYLCCNSSLLSDSKRSVSWLRGRIWRALHTDNEIPTMKSQEMVLLETEGLHQSGGVVSFQGCVVKPLVNGCKALVLFRF